MKIKTLTVLCSLLITAIATTSCLNDNNENIELSANASITAFSINDIETKVATKTSSGKDTTITVTVTGDDYPFVIDQNNRLIYNVDSLPVGTDISKVVVNITSDSNYVLIINQEDADKDSLWTSTDSLNYTKNVMMKVIALNGTYGPTYITKINVHKQVPDSLEWSKFESNIVSTGVEKQKSVYFNSKIFVACNVNGKAMITYTSSTDGRDWSNETEIPMAGADVSSLMTWGDNLYILASNTLYKSADGNTWEKVNGAPQLKQIISNYYSESVATLSAIDTNDHFQATNDGITWTDNGIVESTFPTENLSYASYVSKHNDNIYSQIVMGNNPTSKDSTINVWGNLSTENKWEEYTYNKNGHYCPNLENITMIHYNDMLYAFGGKSQNANKEYEPFSKFFVSDNNGSNWNSVTSNMVFPETFATLYNNAKGNYSCTIDNNKFIWIIFSNSNEVWKGRINKLGFNQTK